ncbi:D-alanyl-D-alanine carboxypeptidase family protein [Microbacterium sp. C7(2022)]|uniref:D-alanyl-D-alanine carboxypeptidase family protein n=1 Tax=Microbacterium sp. C7(2022) TaxID=2992759 RepID=UPI00237B8570|nr:D-alanyl-D-alanine carboxypeptidase [Microbacterium sp. C7(2022)]MDE0546557.1 D-alanyl-D-alanine carboxypeptidase [Microbacterium sp. C7(2022)]
MTLDDAPSPTRRSRRAAEYENLSFEPDDTLANPVFADAETGDSHDASATDIDVDRTVEADADVSVDAAANDSLDAAAETAVIAADDADSEADTPRLDTLALTWVTEETIAQRRPAGDLGTVTSGYLPAGADLLADAPRRSIWRASVLTPIIIAVVLFGGYAATTLLWPLHAVAPTIVAQDVASAPAAAAVPAWPDEGSASVAVAGISDVLESSTSETSIASITKVVTALIVLDEMPLDVGEQGPSYSFTYNDMLSYWQYRARGESALDVPVGGSLTQYQMLQGMLIGSANNYADRLASNLFPSDQVFADAANAWLDLHGVPGITVVEPTGIDAGNVASPDALIALAKKALADPVIAEIVATAEVELPGAGLVENTNTLLEDEGVLGIKTGTLAGWNLLSAKQVTVAGTPVTIYASVLDQVDDEARTEASRAIYDQVESELQPVPSVTAGTVAGQVETLWAEPVNIVTAGDASVILWNGDSGDVTVNYSLGDASMAGDAVGTLAVAGPLDSTTVDLQLADDIEQPSAWWRITHPLELFGLTS